MGRLETLYARAVKGTTDPKRRADLLTKSRWYARRSPTSREGIGYYEPSRPDSARARHASPRDAVRARRTLRAPGRVLEHGSLPRPSRDRRLKSGLVRSTSTSCTIAARARAPRGGAPSRRQQRRGATPRRTILDIGSLRSAPRNLEAVYERGTRCAISSAFSRSASKAQARDLRRSLLQRVATLRDERLQDDAGAMNALARLVRSTRRCAAREPA